MSCIGYCFTHGNTIKDCMMESTEKEFLWQFFGYAHLPEHLQSVSEPFCRLAEIILNGLPNNPERTTALRKLLESKDCAVRAALAK